MREHLLELLHEGLAAPALPALGEAGLLAREAPLPDRIEFGGDHRGVVGPVLEQAALALQQPVELFGAVAAPPREEDHVMSALDRADAIDLHEPQVPHQRQQRRAAQPAAGRIAEAVMLEKQPAGLAV